LLHWRNAPDVWAAEKVLNARDTAIAAQVSEYAVESGSEFVAEVFAGLMDGISFPSDVMALYATLKGLQP